MQGGFTDIVPCGKCVLCIKKRINSWTFRLQEEEKISTSSAFITFTYENTPLSFNGHATLKKTDFQKFLKRLRKQLKKSNIKYYACGEYGTSSLRPHYHAIIFNLPQQMLSTLEPLTRLWSHGNIFIAPNTIATTKYTIGYLNKGKFEPLTDCDDRLPEFSLMSKKMGLSYLTPQMLKHHKEKLISFITKPGGQFQPLPRYFKDKIFSPGEKHILAKEATIIREINFQKMFDDSHIKHDTWKKDQLRKQQKQLILERQKL